MGMNRGMQDLTCLWDCFFYAVAAAAAAARNESKVTHVVLFVQLLEDGEEEVHFGP
jgi:hypothetical protein